jgi:hypothetical protein
LYLKYDDFLVSIFAFSNGLTCAAYAEDLTAVLDAAVVGLYKANPVDP